MANTYAAKKSVLLVEDNEDCADLMGMCLSKHNSHLKLHTVRDGEEALNYLMATENVPDLVILDLELPKVTGLDVLGAIRGKVGLRSMPVVIFSASGDPANIERSLQLGANSYVQKQVSFDSQAKTLQLIHDYWLGVHEPAPDLSSVAGLIPVKASASGLSA